ncbi:hypothetical protein JCM8547_008195 [Rhodosporidiobolus lusitaniae]
MQVDNATDAAGELDDELAPLHLADAALENVSKCGECGKPVLQSAMEEHTATCAAIREGRADAVSQNLKRRLSEASASSSQVPKKSKLVLHLGGAAGDKTKTPSSSSATPGPPEKKNKRVVDVDRQCGVINDKGYPCPRSLTCKTHNMSHKRAVPGRSQPYDILLFEWQKANKAKEKPPAAEGVVVRSGTSSRPGGATPATGDITPHAPAMVVPGGAGVAAGAGEAPVALGKTKKRKSGVGADGASVFKVPGEKKSKKGVVFVGEWEESDDEVGADEMVDSEEEVEAVLRGIGRVDRGRPLYMMRGGGAGFSAAAMFNGRNTRLLRLHDVLQDVFRPPLA